MRTTIAITLDLAGIINGVAALIVSVIAWRRASLALRTSRRRPPL